MGLIYLRTNERDDVTILNPQIQDLLLSTIPESDGKKVHFTNMTNILPKP